MNITTGKGIDSNYYAIATIGKFSLGLFSKWMGFRFNYLEGLGNRLDLGFLKIVYKK
jgi:hypothetical protein